MNKWQSVGRGTLAILALSSGLSVGGLAHAEAPPPISASVVVNAAAPLGVVPATALGVNTAVWDGDLMASSTPGMLRAIHVAMLRYPGGSTSDEYNWQTNTVTGGYANPDDDFANFMTVAQSAGAQPIITVNAGTGTAAEAAAWVKDANVTNHYGVKYWEIGNEMYGSWEAGNFAGNPQGYAELASTYIQAMKAVDPSIQIGVDLIAPGTGQAGWNSTVLSTLASLGTLPDFAIVHWYAQNSGGETDAGLLSSTQEIGSMMSVLKSRLSPYGHIPVFVTETNSVSSNPGKQTTSLVNALFLDNDFMDWFQSGAQNVDWWDLHNGATAGNDAASLYGSTNYGDYGLLSNGSSANGSTEPAVNTPFPDYYGYEMLGPLLQPGATLVGAGSSNSMVSVHASRLQNGDLSIMLVNKDPVNTYSVNLDLEGYRAAGPVTEWTYGEGSTAVAQVTAPQLSQSIAVQPYSVTDIVLHGGPPMMPGAVVGPQPGAPVGPPPVATQPPTAKAPRPVPPVPTPPLPSQTMTDATSVASSSIQPSYDQTVTTTFTDNGLPVHNASLDVEIYSPSGSIVGQKWVSDVSIQHGQTSAPVTVSWTVPDVQGDYTVRAFAFGPHADTLLFADQNAANFTVTAPNPIVQGDVSVTTSLSSNNVTVGTPVTITTTYTNTSATDWLSDGILNQYVYLNGNWATQFAQNDTLAPGQTITQTTVYTPTAAGTYTFPVGLFTGSWGFLQWFNNTGIDLTVSG